MRKIRVQKSDFLCNFSAKKRKIIVVSMLSTESFDEFRRVLRIKLLDFCARVYYNLIRSGFARNM